MAPPAAGAPPAAAAIASQLIAVASAGSRRATADHAERNGTPAPAPAALDMRCLDGLRSLSCVLVMLFHTMYVWCQLAGFEVANTLIRHHWLVRLAAKGGPLSVDFFLLLTALLACYQLVPLLEGSPSGKAAGKGAQTAPPPSPLRQVLSYWRKRALRVVPAYAAANLLLLCAMPKQGLSPEADANMATSFNGCPVTLPLNVLFISNLIPVFACGAHLWSLAVQVHFYIAFPLLLCALRPHVPGFRARLAATLAAVFAAGTAWRLWLAFKEPALTLPLGDLAEPAGVEGFLALYLNTYFSTPQRAAQLAAGAATGLLLRSSAATRWLRQRRALLSTAALCLQAAYVHVVLSWSHFSVPGELAWSPLASRLYAALLFFGSPFLTALLGVTLLALLLGSDPVHSAAAAALGARALRPLSTLSYCIYLTHEHARLWAFAYGLPAGWVSGLVYADPLHGLLSMAGVTLAAALPTAYLLHVLVEKRF